MSTLGILVGAAVTAALIGALALGLLPLLVRRCVRILLTRPMSDTLAELYVSTRSTPPLDLLYTSLRSATGRSVVRPMGSAKPARGFDDLALVPAQLARRPRLETEPVDLSVRLGPGSARPLDLSMPLYISGMAYGLAVTRAARLAFAEASGRCRIALNSGQGPFLAEERRRCHRYVLQFGRWNWNRDPEILRQADMIEVQVGQGAMPGNAVVAGADEIGPEVRRLMRLAAEERPDIHADLYLDRPDRPASLAEVVAYLREVAPGRPIAVKLGAGQDLEPDLQVAIDAAVDVVVVDGTEGATGNAPITLSDHFGIPSLPALARTVRYLERRGVRDQVSVCISGGFREPGDILKACALGADAVGVATVAMFAIAHPQIADLLPFYPPTDLVFYRARPAVPLDPRRAADALVNFLESTRAEMEIALRAMGKRRLADLGPEDLVAMNREVASWAQVAYVGEPRRPAHPEGAPPAAPRVAGRLPELGRPARLRRRGP